MPEAWAHEAVVSVEKLTPAEPVVPDRQSKADCLAIDSLGSSSGGPLLMLQLDMGRTRVLGLIDSGASHNFMGLKFAKQ